MKASLVVVPTIFILFIILYFFVNNYIYFILSFNIDDFSAYYALKKLF